MENIIKIRKWAGKLEVSYDNGDHRLASSTPSTDELQSYLKQLTEQSNLVTELLGPVEAVDSGVCTPRNGLSLREHVHVLAEQWRKTESTISELKRKSKALQENITLFQKTCTHEGEHVCILCGVTFMKRNAVIYMNGESEAV